MNLISYPPLVHAAFNPAVLELSRQYPTDDKAEIRISYLDISGQSKIATLKREMHNDVVTFDVSPTIKRLFYDKQNNLSSGIFVDSNLVTPYVLGVDDGRTAVSMPLLTINAVVQLGESSNFTTKTGTFLTSFEKIFKYEGYYLDVACLGFNFDVPDPVTIEGDSYIGFGDNLQNIKAPHFCVEIPDNIHSVNLANKYGWEELRNFSNEVITNDQGEPILIRNIPSGYIENILYVENKCTPVNPFYVRWINQVGGWDYWMFSFRQEKSREINNPQTYNIYINNQETAKSTTRLVTLDGIEKITIGATHLTSKEYQAISKIIYSPQIEWFNEKLGKWLVLIIDESQNTEDTYNPTHSVEFTFELPKPQLQF